MADPTDGDAAVTDESTDADTAPEMAFGVPVSRSGRQRVLHPSRDAYLETVRALRADGYSMVTDVTAVDYLSYAAERTLPAGIEPQRFEVVAGFIHHQRRERVRVRVQVPAHDARVPSLFDDFPGAEALEREVFDMFGITFDNHPDLSRILMPEDWLGYPLRKDYAIGRIPVQFKGAPPTR